MEKSKPIAVLISDIHFNVNNLELASKSLESALTDSWILKIPLVIAGDLLDSKAIIRAECANRIIDILCTGRKEKIVILIGNHDLINEKGKEHSLNFLRPYAAVLDRYARSYLGLNFIPYISDPDEFIKELNRHEGLVICHQGVQGAHLGDYVIDKSSLPKEVFADYRIVSGHYHRAQDIKCGKPRKDGVGLFSYIGSPFTHTFGEANDGPKGYQILYSDGLLKQVVLNLRKHIIVERNVEDLGVPVFNYVPGDLVWLKVKGNNSQLDKLKKKEIGERLFGHSDFKLDKIYENTNKNSPIVSSSSNVQDLLDRLIDELKDEEYRKNRLKSLWRETIK